MVFYYSISTFFEDSYSLAFDYDVHNLIFPIAFFPKSYRWVGLFCGLPLVLLSSLGYFEACGCRLGVDDGLKSAIVVRLRLFSFFWKEKGLWIWRIVVMDCNCLHGRGIGRSNEDDGDAWVLWVGFSGLLFAVGWRREGFGFLEI